MELPREEVALLLGTLTACGFLILGVLELMWPTAPRGAPAAPRAFAASSWSAVAARPTAPARPPRPVEIQRPLPAPRSAPEVARVLLERAQAEADLERRVTILNRAVASSSASASSSGELLATARAQLWQTWERIALARLAAAMPWNGEILAAETTSVLTRTR